MVSLRVPVLTVAVLVASSFCGHYLFTGLQNILPKRTAAAN